MIRVFQLDALSNCLDCPAIDKALDDLRIDKAFSQRIVALYQYMGVSQSFTSTCGDSGLSLSEEYALAKNQLVLMNTRRMGKQEEYSVSITRDTGA